MQIRLKEILAQRGLSQLELAEMVGVTPAAVSNALSRGNITLAVLDSYAQVLNIPTWELLVSGGEFEEPEQKAGLARNAMIVTCPDCKQKLELTLSVKTL